MTRTFLHALLVVSLCLLPIRSGAQAVEDVSNVLTLRVLTGWREEGGRHIAGLEVTLQAGWHTYWRSAGSLGISPSFDWRGSDNVRQVRPAWPHPQIFREEAGLSYGYKNRFVLPLVVQARDATQAVKLVGQIDMGVCDEICIPARVRFATALIAPGAPDAAIRAALATQPRRVTTTARCRIAPSGNALTLQADLPVPSQGGEEAVVFELPGTDAWITDAKTRRNGGVLHAEAEIIGLSGAVERSALRITVLGERSAVEITGCSG